MMPVLSTVEGQLSLHKCNIEKQFQKHGNGKNPMANYEQAKVRNCTGVTVLCVHPVDSQSQLECISPPVGRPTTRVVTPLVQ